MQASEKLRSEVARAETLLSGEGMGDQTPSAALAAAIRWLEPIAPDLENALDAPLAALDRALAELDLASEGLREVLQSLDYDPYELERVTERLFALRAAARKHAVLADELPAVASGLADQVAALDHGVVDLASAKTAVTEAQDGYMAAAERLSQARHRSGARLNEAVMAELAPLKMERAEFVTVIGPADPGPQGVDAVAFEVATNPGAPSGPLARIASGGELSRFLLAIKVCLAKRGPRRTLIFDEIDRGVGGATADAVGRRLAALSQGNQVLVVTHSPQVAALGEHHWRVEKRIEQNQTLSTVAELPPEQRVKEIARMLAGDRITDAARAAAAELLSISSR